MGVELTFSKVKKFYSLESMTEIEEEINVWAKSGYIDIKSISHAHAIKGEAQHERHHFTALVVYSTRE